MWGFGGSEDDAADRVTILTLTKLGTVQVEIAQRRGEALAVHDARRLHLMVGRPWRHLALDGQGRLSGPQRPLAGIYSEARAEPLPPAGEEPVDPTSAADATWEGYTVSRGDRSKSAIEAQMRIAGRLTMIIIGLVVVLAGVMILALGPDAFQQARQWLPSEGG